MTARDINVERLTGTGPGLWQARCPERNHPVFINAADNAFGCGWCKRRSGFQEFREFVRPTAYKADMDWGRNHLTV